ncbi:hypothetical protein DR999_PMT20611 [Platysternon megacephalum]|uniref:Uncharacterized protein n=1 Tax=Platysternon megacephalum TaxID=55544 RepID=A0A4D9DQ16_9SAUR|nr:hypothetical protein DR999_PMT20611 [Platysternon megacephalum]
MIPDEAAVSALETQTFPTAPERLRQWPPLGELSSYHAYPAPLGGPLVRSLQPGQIYQHPLPQSLQTGGPGAARPSKATTFTNPPSGTAELRAPTSGPRHTEPGAQPSRGRLLF